MEVKKENESCLKVFVEKKFNEKSKEDPKKDKYYYTLRVQLYDADEDDLTDLVREYLDKSSAKLLRKCGVKFIDLTEGK